MALLGCSKTRIIYIALDRRFIPRSRPTFLWQTIQILSSL
jgi:hypothetical protein